jgi:hypothetical protein
MTDAGSIWESKLSKLQEDNLEDKMKPLVALMGELREISEGRTVPNFDPDDGGVDAEVLLLFQDPGPKVEETTFISKDNPDSSARRVKGIEREVDLDRGRTVRWNVVPWQILDGDRKSEMKRVKDEKCLTHLLKKFEGRNLKAVALFGSSRVWAFADEVKKARPDLEVFDTYHPGDRGVNRWPHVLPHIEKTYREIKDFLDR